MSNNESESGTDSPYQDIVALTGCFGSGKSTVANMFGEMGACVIDADDLAREVVKPGTPGLHAITEAFGAKYISQSGELDRERLGELVFSNPKDLARLESIIHPLIAERAKTLFEKCRKLGHAPIIYEIPLLFEKGWQTGHFKKVIVVSATKEKCTERAASRTGLSHEKVRRRLDAQIPISAKEKQADYVIDNSASLDETRKQATEVYARLY